MLCVLFLRNKISCKCKILSYRIPSFSKQHLKTSTLKNLQWNDPLFRSERKSSRLPPLLQNIKVCKIRKSICIRKKKKWVYIESEQETSNGKNSRAVFIEPSDLLFLMHWRLCRSYKKKKIYLIPFFLYTMIFQFSSKVSAFLYCKSYAYKCIEYKLNRKYISNIFATTISKNVDVLLGFFTYQVILYSPRETK